MRKCSYGKKSKSSAFCCVFLLKIMTEYSTRCTDPERSSSEDEASNAVENSSELPYSRQECDTIFTCLLRYRSSSERMSLIKMCENIEKSKTLRRNKSSIYARLLASDTVDLIRSYDITSKEKSYLLFLIKNRKHVYMEEVDNFVLKSIAKHDEFNGKAFCRYITKRCEQLRYFRVTDLMIYLTHILHDLNDYGISDIWKEKIMSSRIANKILNKNGDTSQMEDGSSSEFQAENDMSSSDSLVNPTPQENKVYSSSTKKISGPNLAGKHDEHVSSSQDISRLKLDAFDTMMLNGLEANGRKNMDSTASFNNGKNEACRRMSRKPISGAIKIGTVHLPLQAALPADLKAAVLSLSNTIKEKYSHFPPIHIDEEITDLNRLIYEREIESEAERLMKKQSLTTDDKVTLLKYMCHTTKQQPEEMLHTLINIK